MVKIRVCDGPMCGVFASDNLATLRRELEKLKITDQVDLDTCYCMGSCKHSPCIRINGVKYTNVTMDQIPALVRESVLPLVGI